MPVKVPQKSSVKSRKRGKKPADVVEKVTETKDVSSTNSVPSETESGAKYLKDKKCGNLTEVKLDSVQVAELEKLVTNLEPVKVIHNGAMKGKFKNSFKKVTEESFEEKISRTVVDEIKNDEKINQSIKESFKNKQKEKGYKEMQVFRNKLPSYKKKNELLKAINKNQIVVISGETGCGKTTQIAQYVLDDHIMQGKGSLCRIVCTQPRRISAVSVAERVAAERNEKLGNSVGYQIRVDKVLPRRDAGSVLFVTTGVLLQWLNDNPTLNGISHIFLDEIHERDVLCDFTVAYLKLIIEKRPSLKIILMSATLKAEDFSNYFGGTPWINIPGITFPVEDIYLEHILMMPNMNLFNPNKVVLKQHNILPKTEDAEVNTNETAPKTFENHVIPYIHKLLMNNSITESVAQSLCDFDSGNLNVHLIFSVIRYLCGQPDNGAILVFVPGLEEIESLYGMLTSDIFFSKKRYLIIPIHSLIPTINQKDVFTKPPAGVRKIIIATNIVETSITIDDLVYVIDSGYMKMVNFDNQSNVSTLLSQWISGVNVKQRKGRAGRVQAGKCFKLYTKAREEMFDPFPVPEIQRKRLEGIILQAKMLQLDSTNFLLEKVMDHPDSLTVSLSIKALQDLRALNEHEKITPLGFLLAKLALEPNIGKMVIMAAMFGCVDPILSIAAVLALKDPYIATVGRPNMVKDIKLSFAYYQPSDHLVISSTIKQWELACKYRGGYEFAEDNNLSVNTLFSIRALKTQLARFLYDMNLLKTPRSDDLNGNKNSQFIELVKAVVCAGLYPNVAKRTRTSHRKFGNKLMSETHLETINHGGVRFHPKSVCRGLQKFDSPFFVYNEMLKGNKGICIHDASMVHPLPLMFFGEELSVQELDETSHVIHLHKLISFKCSKRDSLLIQNLRQHLDWVLTTSFSNPEIVDWNSENHKVQILRSIVLFITFEMLRMKRMDYC